MVPLTVQDNFRKKDMSCFPTFSCELQVICFKLCRSSCGGEEVEGWKFESERSGFTSIYVPIVRCKIQ